MRESADEGPEKVGKGREYTGLGHEDQGHSFGGRSI